MATKVEEMDRQDALESLESALESSRVRRPRRSWRAISQTDDVWDLILEACRKGLGRRPRKSLKQNAFEILFVRHAAEAVRANSKRLGKNVAKDRAARWLQPQLREHQDRLREQGIKWEPNGKVWGLRRIKSEIKRAMGESAS